MARQDYSMCAVLRFLLQCVKLTHNSVKISPRRDPGHSFFLRENSRKHMLAPRMLGILVKSG